MRGWLTPNNDDGQLYVLLSIPSTVEWIACLRGAILSLTYDYNWEQFGAMTPEETAQKWLEIFEAIETFEGDLLKDIRLNDAMLQKMFWRSDTWVDVGNVMRYKIRAIDGGWEMDLDGNDTYEINQFTNSTQNIYGEGLPFADVNDQICRASWALANSLADDFRDVMRYAVISQRISAGIVQMMAEATVVLGLTDDTIRFVSETLPQLVLDWIKDNSTDPDTIAQLAEWIYCSIQTHLPDDLDDVIKDIPLGIYAPVFTVIDVGRQVEWGNFEDVADSIYNTAVGKSVAYLIIGYAQSSHRAVLEFLGAYKPTEGMIRAAMSSAQYFDARDCEFDDCDPLLIVTFDSNNVVPFTLSEWGALVEISDDNNWLEKSGAANAGTNLHRVQFTANFVETSDLAGYEFDVYVLTQVSANRNILVVILDGATEIYTHTFSNLAEGTVHHLSDTFTAREWDDLTFRVYTGTINNYHQTLRIDNIQFNRNI